MGVKLTANEKVALQAMFDSEYNDGADQPWVWSFSVTDRMVDIPKTSRPGVISSLVQKGLVLAEKGQSKTYDSLSLTKTGKAACDAHGIGNKPWVDPNAPAVPTSFGLTGADLELWSD